MMVRGGTVYIITNKKRTTLYVGVTSDLVSRIIQHKNKNYPKSFSARYQLYVLIYYENLSSIEEAIDREKYIKGKTRKWKEELIGSMNPEWRDLSEEVMQW